MYRNNFICDSSILWFVVSRTIKQTVIAFQILSFYRGKKKWKLHCFAKIQHKKQRSAELTKSQNRRREWIQALIPSAIRIAILKAVSTTIFYCDIEIHCNWNNFPHSPGCSIAILSRMQQESIHYIDCLRSSLVTIGDVTQQCVWP